MSKATKGTSTLFPQVSRGESNDAAKGLLDDAGDSSGDEANYAPRGEPEQAAAAGTPSPTQKKDTGNPQITPPRASPGMDG